MAGNSCKVHDCCEVGSAKVADEMFGEGNPSTSDLIVRRCRRVRFCWMCDVHLFLGPLSCRLVFVKLAESLIDGGSEVEAVR